MSPIVGRLGPASGAEGLVQLVAQAAVDLDAQRTPRRLPVCLTYTAAAEELGIGVESVDALVKAGVLVRPEWSLSEVRVRVVTTASVLAASGWPITAVEVAIPAEDIA